MARASSWCSFGAPGRVVGLVVIGAMVVGIGCGSEANAALVGANDTVRATGAAVTELSTSGGEIPLGDPQDSESVAARLREVERRQAELEEAVAIWEEEDLPRAYYLVAPCMAAALRDLRAALEAANHAIPPNVDEALALLEDAGDRQCAGRF